MIPVFDKKQYLPKKVLKKDKTRAIAGLIFYENRKAPI